MALGSRHSGMAKWKTDACMLSVEPGVGNIDFFAFDTHATNSIPMCSAEYADHNGAIGTLNTQR